MLTVPPQVHWARCGQGPDIALLDLHTGTWRILSGAGARIWEAVTVRGGVEGLADEIAIPNGHDPAAARAAVNAFVAGLCDAGLLTADSPRAPSRTRWWNR